MRYIFLLISFCVFLGSSLPLSAYIKSVEATGIQSFTGRGNKNELALKIKVETEGAYSFGRMTLDLGSTTSIEDIEAIRIYADSTLLLGSYTDLSRELSCELGKEVFSGEVTLWVTFDVHEKAAEGNKIGITLTGLDDFEILPVESSREILLKRVLVMAPGDFGSGYYRIPAIITAKDASLVCVTDARKFDQGDLPQDIDVVLRRSYDGGATWSEPLVLAKGEGYAKGYGDAALVHTNEENGLLCVFAGGTGLWTSTSSEPIRCYYSKSADNGLSWSEPVDITSQIYGEGCEDPERAKWQAAFCASGRGLLTSSGRIMFVAAVRYAQDSYTLYNHVVYSDDNGQSWKVSDVAMAGGDEAKVVELSDGSILMSIRHQGGGARYFNRSFDNGESWEKACGEWEDLIEPGCNGDIISYSVAGMASSEELLLHSLPDDARQRKNVTVFVSHDEGKTWKRGRRVSNGSSAYSSLTVLEDGTIGVYVEESDESQRYSTYFINVSYDYLSGGGGSQLY